HMRFPYGVVCALFAMPQGADEDMTPQRHTSTFQRARMLLGTISGRADYVSPGEKFEDVTMMLFRPLRVDEEAPRVRLFSATPRHDVVDEVQELQYFERVRDLYNGRNPHAQVGLERLDDEDAE